MKILTHIQEGLTNLYHARLRSLLALLGVLVGTASVVAMVLGGELATSEALKEFKSLGTDLLAVSINADTEESHRSSGSPDKLTLQQAFALNRADKGILQVAPYTEVFYPVSYQGKSLNAIILGVTDSFADIVHLHLASGRFVSIVDGYQFYAVVGRGIYDDMKKITYREPLGQTLQVGKDVFVVIGVADSWPQNSFVYADVDHSLMVPLEASTLISQFASITSIIMRLAPDAPITDVETHISKQLSDTIHTSNVSYRSAKELIAKMRKQSEILTVFLGLIGGVSLIVGGIGVMNIMLVSVVERRREIGIRMAVGATRKDIGMLFLLEAIMLSLTGGVLGVIIGVLIAYIIAMLWHWEFTIYLLPPLTGFAVSVLVGIFFGCYPAMQAAKLDPIEALRGE
jgi:putative ABC transport system permease protein